MLPFLIQHTPLWILQRCERFLLVHYEFTKYALTHINPQLLHLISQKKALHIFHKTSLDTPAYQQFLDHRQVAPHDVRSIDAFNTIIPATEKENYIKVYSYEDRCVNGCFPTHGNIDESSGTSGKPTNWIRSVKEEDLLFKMAEFEFKYTFKTHKENIMVISAWSSGPWATGIKFCQLMEHYALVKNTDTDVRSIVETLKLFGKKYHYLIAGYPPFLKKLIDESGKQIRWKQYRIDLLTGGEGIVLEWKEYMRKRLDKKTKIISSYGASDIDIGVGFETPLCALIRELCAVNKDLRVALFGDLPTLPMIFQYNPLTHYITNYYNEYEKKHEFLITVLDDNVASPKVKYNLHDEGGVYSYRDMIYLVENLQPDYLSLLKKGNNIPEDILHLPFIFLAGRTDGTISLDGANVYPHQIEICLHKDKTVAKKVQAFKIVRHEDKHCNITFVIKIEVKKGVARSFSLARRIHNVILSHLLTINRDYEESYINNKKATDPHILLYLPGSKEFSDDLHKIKNQYIG